jgi:uncharacterized protein YjbI with pentapeptide repeats
MRSDVIRSHRCPIRRRCNFSNSKLNGSYFIKAVTYQANFTGADVSDVLWDRAVIGEAKLRNAQLQVCRHSGSAVLQNF